MNETDEEKLVKLVDYMRKEFPKGCGNISCHGCPLYNQHDYYSEQLCYLMTGGR